MWRPKLMSIPTADEALPGREEPMAVPEQHFVNGQSLTQMPAGTRQLIVGMGCFWGAERRFWTMDGVEVTAVGYAGGTTPNPTYQEVCSGQTGHTEVVRIWYRPEVVSLEALLTAFWESHDPTQGMRQGNDVGTQYRSALYAADANDLAQALASRDHYQQRLTEAGQGGITTEIRELNEFYFAEADHQQYLAKNPGGYCGLSGCNVSY
ncbi:peptide methionine sulfoxide reductase MsrA [Bacterioplanes sanyensis]|uniref:peptide-methionine (S)-S-oxide reductase MsrA n=1 Tax=Bacterioplanes sanyensis TaxID=1249553 RepID=UPI0016792B12|nr:peptide-methionine (S)-S-oxide reductase MsrA [Bacterioplanes sanyensis]GGY44299.1 peptide methionine sulfoxide reductase MsrA [Bacterioplanes sanyensis]